MTKIGLIETFSRVYPKKASTRRVNKKIADSTRNQRVFFSRYLAANYGDGEDASSMVTAGATADTTEENSRASRNRGCCVHRRCSHGNKET